MKQQVLYLFPNMSSFIEKDIDFLSKDYSVIIQHLPWGNKHKVVLCFLNQFFYLLRHIKNVRCIFVMFGGYWSFLPSLIGKIYQKPVFIILGGTDAVSFPSLNYGSLRKPILRWFIKKSYQWATKLLPVDDTLMKQDYQFYKPEIFQKQGVKAFFPKLKTSHQTIYNGFDETFFYPEGTKNPLLFTTVAFANNRELFFRKGGDFLIEIAKNFPDAQFQFIGVSHQLKEQLSDLPKNLNILPPLTSKEILPILQKSQFYVQLSISEGFPNALCEAMLCGCIPIGSAVGGIPHIIQNHGVLIEKADIKEMIYKIRNLINTSPDVLNMLSIKSRKHIAINYSISKRRKIFKELIEENKS